MDRIRRRLQRPHHADLDSIAHRVATEISPDERMPSTDVQGYLRVGESALRSIRIAQLAGGAPDFGNILDFACGHGRVLRWLKAAYPQARLFASDILPDAVDFCVRQFGATGILSGHEPARAMFKDRYDLIWVGSLLTHVDVPKWRRLIALWVDLLTADGILVITTHGEFVARRMDVGHLYGYPAQQIKRMLRAYEHAGFAFLEESPTSVDYGISVARPDWVLREVMAYKELRSILAAEMLWDTHQDVFAFRRHSLDADVLPP